MGTYCTVQDVWEQIKISAEEMPDEEIEKRITEAEKWVETKQDTAYSAPVDDMIKYATACYAASLVLDFLFTTTEPNASSQSKRLMERANEYLEIYNESQQAAGAGLEKINSDFFD